MSESVVEKVTPFPRVFIVANALELFERLAFYGVYINLSVYLVSDVGLTDKENGALLGLFALGRAWTPVGTGAVADRITFRRSLLLSFFLYACSYLALFYRADAHDGVQLGVRDGARRRVFEARHHRVRAQVFAARTTDAGLRDLLRDGERRQRGRESPREEREDQSRSARRC